MDRIIQDKQIIHSCYDYGGHLEFVRNSVIRNTMLKKYHGIRKIWNHISAGKAYAWYVTL